MGSKAIIALPLRVKKVLQKLGADIKDARRRRRIPVAIMAKRAMISKTTLLRVERGAPEVSAGIYATVLFILGLEHKLANIADIQEDVVGLSLEEERLPKRIRIAKHQK